MAPARLPDELVARLAGVRSVGAITGAGISAESGIPTYRGKGGIYDDPEAGDRTIESLSAPTLATDPDRTWRTIAELAQRARAARPNPGHDALVAIERKVDRFVLLTQNVDRLHQDAGSVNVIDIHGNVFATVCMECNAPGALDDPSTVTATPRCASCGGPIRPDVVLFEEALPVDKLRRIYLELHQRIPDLVVAVGTSALFPYVIEPLLVARRAGRLTVELNPEPTVLSDHVDFALRGRAGDLLPLVAGAIPSR